MKKFIIPFAAVILLSVAVKAEDFDVRTLDEASRAENPGSSSIMFRKNAEMYDRLSDEQKAEISRQREEARKKMEEYERKKAEYERQKAEYEKRLKEQQEAERKRAEALKPITLYGNGLKIYALVNGEVISSSDMQSRINAFIMMTGIPYNAQTKSMITSKVLQAAIDEKLKIQEAKKNKIKVTPQELKNAVRDFEKSNGMSAGQLKKILSNSKVRMSVWAKQIEADIAWKKLISSKGYGRITVGEGEVNRAIADAKKDMKVAKYLLSEIVIEKKDAKDINGLAEALRHDPRFELYAMQFSQDPSAANGGHLGWVAKGRLPAALEKTVSSLKDGEVSAPVAYGNDYYIFKMEKNFNPATDAQALPDRKQVKTYLENKKLEEFSDKYIKDLRNRALIEKKV